MSCTSVKDIGPEHLARMGADGRLGKVTRSFPVKLQHRSKHNAQVEQLKLFSKQSNWVPYTF